MSRRGGPRGPGSAGPRSVAAAMRELRADTAPATLLAAVQEAWPAVAGERVAAQSEPVSEREGVVIVACRSATWAQELDLLQGELIGRLAGAVADAPGGPLRGLRFTADAARHS